MPSEVSIRCLLSAARHNSFTKAAEELYMSRQAISQQIAALEKELGFKLFDRTTSRISLTPVGELYIRFFTDAIRQWNDTRQAAESIVTRAGEIIRVGCLHAAELGDRVLELTERSRSQGHTFDISWERREVHELLNLLLDGNFDVIFVFDEAYRKFRDKDKLSHFTFDRGQAVIAVRNSYPLASPGATAKDFEAEPCYLAAGMQHNEQSKLEFLQGFAACGLHFTDVRIVPNRESMQTMVEAGKGFTVCTDLERFARFPNILTYPIQRYQDVYCVWRRTELRPQVLAFVDAMRG